MNRVCVCSISSFETWCIHVMSQCYRTGDWIELYMHTHSVLIWSGLMLWPVPKPLEDCSVIDFEPRSDVIWSRAAIDCFQYRQSRYLLCQL